MSTDYSGSAGGRLTWLIHHIDRHYQPGHAKDAQRKQAQADPTGIWQMNEVGDDVGYTKRAQPYCRRSRRGEDCRLDHDAVLNE